MNLSHRTRAGRRAFTLVEVMVASSISIVAIGLSLGILVSVVKLNAATELKEQLDADYRSMTRVLIDIGRTANGFYIYPKFSDTKRTAVGVGQGGDMLVLVFYSSQDVNGDPNTQRIGRIVGVMRDYSDSQIGKLRWFDSTKDNWGQSFTDTNPADASVTVESLLPDAALLSKFPVLASMTVGGTVSGGDMNIFMNINNGSAYLVNGLVYRTATSATSMSLADANASPYTSKNAFNLTVCPRS